MSHSGFAKWGARWSEDHGDHSTVCECESQGCGYRTVGSVTLARALIRDHIKTVHGVDSNPCPTCGGPRPCRTCGGRPDSIRPGDTFGSWTVIDRFGSTSRGAAVFWCQCSCGEQYAIPANNLKRGRSTRCRSCAGRASRERAA